MRDALPSLPHHHACHDDEKASSSIASPLIIVTALATRLPSTRIIKFDSNNYWNLSLRWIQAYEEKIAAQNEPDECGA